MINALKEYLNNCPYFSELREIGIDFLLNKLNVASIEKAPINPIIETYLDGSSKRQVAYYLRARFPYSDEVRNNIENSEFYEKVSEWIENNNKNSIYPNLGNKKHVETVEIVSSDYLASIADNIQTACYQLQLKIIYIEEE